MKAAWLDRSAPKIYAEARVARQRTCPIGELIEPDGETRFLEYKSTMRWDVKLSEKAKYIEDSIVKTIAGFANSISIDPSDHPVLEQKGDNTYFWWRTPVSTDNVADSTERERLISRRWAT